MTEEPISAQENPELPVDPAASKSQWWVWVLFVLLIALSAGWGAHLLFFSKRKSITPSALAPTPSATVSDHSSECEPGTSGCPVETEEDELSALERDLNGILETDPELETLPEVDFDLGV